VNPRRLHLDRELLDRQIVDRHGRLVGNVDDVAFDLDGDGTPYLRSLLVGQVALGHRIGGRVGRALIRIADRLTDRPPARAQEVPFRLVVAVESAVVLSASVDELPDPPMERWLRHNLIDRIPGAGRAGG
jgi:sporulation protein YlmC with PRC-barrel domain